MSSNPLDAVDVPENMIRDFSFTAEGAVAPATYDTPNTFNAMGLDLFIRNRGAAALTIAIQGQGGITVDPGDVYTLNNVKFWLVTIVSAVLYDLQIFGVRITTLRRRGLMK